MLTLFSFALYQLNMFFAFLIPLRLVFLRRGGKDFLISAGTVLSAIVVFGLLRIRPTGNTDEYMRTIGLFWIAIAPLFLAGLYITDSEFPGVQRRLHKLLIATGIAGIAGIPLMAAIGGIEEVFRANLTLAETFFPGMNTFLAASVGLDSTEAAIDVNTLVLIVKESFLGSYLVIYFTVLAIAVAISDWIFGRASQTKRWSLLKYHVSNWMIWLLLTPWAVVLLNQRIDVKVAGYIALNLGIIMLLVYGIQGYAIVKAILAKRNAPKGLNRLVSLLCVVFLFWPGFRFLIIIGLPVLGVSELWIHYRISAEE